MKQEIVIDADRFTDFATFSDYFSQVALGGQYQWSGNLDAFNDILRGGFGTPEGGFVIVWRNHRKSREELGTKFDILLEVIREHGPGGDEEEDGIELRLE